MEVISVKVRPHASINSIEGWADTERNTIVLKVTAPAEGGKANAAVIKLLSSELGISKQAIIIKRGQSSQYKLLTLDIAPEKLEAWLERLC